MNTTEPETITTTEDNAHTAPKQQAEVASCPSKSSICCRPHTSLLVACIAIVIAIYALVADHNRTDKIQAQARLSNIEEQITSINTQLNTLGANVKRNRENLIHTKLQKALENVQEIGQIATTDTRSKLAEIETMLHDIITPAAGKASATTAAPVETPASPDTQAVPNEAPAKAVTTPSETAPAASAPTKTTAAPDKTTQQPPAKTTPSAPAVTAPPAQQPTATPDATKSSKPATPQQVL